MENLLFIYNPRAGKGRARWMLSGVINAFTKAGRLVTAYPTQRTGDARRITRKLAPKFDRVACCGGDGTLHEVMAGLMDLPESARPPVGYLPAGTTNDYARNLALPRGMEEMAALAAGGEPRGVDLGKLGEEYFIYVAAFGLFADTSYSTPQELKNLLGHLAYVLKGASELASHKRYRLKVDYDGGQLEGEYLYGMVSNTISVGGVIGLPAGEVQLDDGRLEALLVEAPKNIAQLNAVVRALARQEYTEESGVKVLHSTRFKFTGEEKVSFTVDGEYGGEYKQVEITAVHTPVKIVYGA